MKEGFLRGVSIKNRISKAKNRNLPFSWLHLECLRSKAGMTLTELLAGILILSMLGLLVTGGVNVVRRVYQKVTAKAEAQQVLVTTVELVTNELAGALEIDGSSENLRILSEKNGIWFFLQSTDGLGICKVYVSEDEADAGSGADISSDTGAETYTGVYPLLSSGAMANKFYTTFDSCSYADGCFTITNLGVYEKRQKETEENAQTPAAELSELKIRAVNLEGT